MTLRMNDIRLAHALGGGLIALFLVRRVLAWKRGQQQRLKASTTKSQTPTVELPQLDELKIPVSWTALWVASIRDDDSKKETPLINDRFAGHLAGKEGKQISQYFQQQWEDTAYLTKEQLVQIQAASITVRVKYFDELLLRKANELRSALPPSSPVQVVIGAAGLDARAFRLNWPENTTVFEIDRDEMLAWKEAKLKEISAESSCSKRVSVSADLADPSWTEKLKGAGYDPQLPSVWLLEGLLIYLPEQAVRKLLTDVHLLCAPGSSLAFDMGNTSMTNRRNRFVEALARVGSPLLCGVDRPERFVAQSGWRNSNVVQLGDKEANYGQLPFRSFPRWLYSPFPRHFFVTAAR